MREKGFTLIEMLVAMAVGGMLLAGILTGVFQTVYGAERITDETTSLMDIENSAHWITRDVILGQSTDLVDGALPVSQMTLTWNDYTAEAKLDPSISHSVTYTYSGTELQRNYDGVVTTVGRYLTNVEFSLSGKRITVVLTSSRDGDASSAVTRSYLIFMRA